MFQLLLYLSITISKIALKIFMERSSVILKHMKKGDMGIEY